MIEETLCPQCNGPMVSRANGKTGQRFWGCKAYPDCRGTRNTDGEAPNERSDYAPSERQYSNDRSRWRQPS